jgi:beta-glucosidase
MPTSTGESKRLVGWQKVSLSVGQTQNVVIDVKSSDSSHPLSYWDVSSHAWKVAPGTYTVDVGNSSRNYSKAGTFDIP